MALVHADTRLAIPTVLLAIMIGCGGEPSAPAVSQPTARAIAENILNAYNSGDYEAASQDWSNELKEEVHRSDFDAAREQTLAKKGLFEEILSVTIMPEQPDAQVTWYEFRARFEKDASVPFLLAIDVDTGKVSDAEL